MGPSRSSIGSSSRGEGRPLNLRRWLRPGMGVKRWLVVVFLGLLLLALGAAHLLRQVTPDLQPGSAAEAFADLVTLQFLPFALRGLVAGSAGVLLVAIGGWRLGPALTRPPPATGPPQAPPLRRGIHPKRVPPP